MLTCVIIIAFFLFAFALYTLAAKLGAKLAKSPCPTWPRSALAILAIILLNFFLQVLLYFSPDSLQITAGVTLFLISILASWRILAAAFRLTFWRGALAWLPILGSMILILLLAFFGIRAYVLEAYHMPTNAMAPAVLGPHYYAVCPLCGGHLLVSQPPSDPRTQRIYGDPPGLCLQCGKTSTVKFPDPPPEITSGDRFLVAKFYAPRRWDVVAHKYHEDIFLKRIVALPGETISLDDGKIIINGKEISLPPELPHPDFTRPPGFPPDSVATPEKPLTLQTDEYFVLGDNTRNSSDSRSYGPIKQSAIVGILTATYWPLSRLHLFR